MHILDGFLSHSINAGTFIISVGILGIFFLALGIGKLIKKSPSGKSALPLLLILLLFLLSTSAFAAHPLITDDTGTQAKREIPIRGEQ